MFYFLDWVIFLFAVLYNAWTMTVVEGWKTANSITKAQSVGSEQLQGKVTNNSNLEKRLSKVDVKEVEDER